MNIVFDIGNVLLRWDPRALYRKVIPDEAQMDWFLAHVCNHDWNLEQDRGRSFADAVSLLQQEHPEHAEAIAAYDTRWDETLVGPIDGTVEILETLHARGAPLYAITNWSAEKFRETRARYKFLRYFRDIVVSGDEKLVKPDRRIYQLFLLRNALPARECIFIDDSMKNVDGAVAVGMKGHHFTSPEKLRSELSGLGLL
ncbi:MAG: HAD family hydrolase [Aestuariivirga sp.]